MFSFGAGATRERSRTEVASDTRTNRQSETQSERQQREERERIAQRQREQQGSLEAVMSSLDPETAQMLRDRIQANVSNMPPIGEGGDIEAIMANAAIENEIQQGQTFQGLVGQAGSAYNTAVQQAAADAESRGQAQLAATEGQLNIQQQSQEAQELDQLLGRLIGAETTESRQTAETEQEVETELQTLLASMRETMTVEEISRVLVNSRTDTRGTAVGMSVAGGSGGSS